MTIQAWPFLVGRNKNLDYQTIVSPQFLTERGLSILLAEAAGGDENGPDEAYYREIHSSEVGDLSLIFRVIRAKAADYDLGGSEILRDKVGRPIRLIEGFVVQGGARKMKEEVIMPDTFEVAHNMVKGAYRKFWHEEDSFVERSSLPFRLPVGSYTARPVELKVQEPFNLPAPPTNIAALLKKKRVIFAICLVLLIIGGIVIYINISPTPSKAISAFCDGLMKADYNEAIDQLTGNKIHVPSKEDFLSFYSIQGKHHVTACSLSIANPSDNTDSATLTLTYSKSSQEQLTFELIKDSMGDWKIDKISCKGNSIAPFC